MAWQYVTNLLLLSAVDQAGRLWVELKDLGVTHGALVVMGTGDGVATFENTGDTAGPYDVLTTAPSTWATASSNSFSHINAWMRLREAGSTREFLIRRHSNGSASFEDDFEIAHSVTGFDDTGIATATLGPTASAGDAKNLVGSVGSPGNWGPSYNNDCRAHIAIQDTAVDGVFAFYIASRFTPSGLPNGMFIYEAINEGLAGDAQPFVIYSPSGGGLGRVEFADLDNVWRLWDDHGGGGELHIFDGSAFGLVDNGGNRIAPGGVPPQSDGDARSFPIPIGRSQLALYKGILAHFRWKGTDSRDYPDTRDLTTVNAQVFFDDLLFPWEQNTVPLT